MPVFRLCIILVDGLGQIVFGTTDVIARDVFVIVEIRSDGGIDDSLISIFHGEHPVTIGHYATFRFHRRASLELHFAFQAFMQGRDAFQCDVIPLRSDDDVLMWAGHRRIKCDFPRLAGSHACDDHLVGKGCKCLTQITDTIHFIAYHGTCRVKAQLPVIVRITRMPRKVQAQIAERLIRHALISLCLHMRCTQVLSLLILAGKHQFTYFRKPFFRFRTRIIIGTSSPNGLLVQLDLLCARIAIKHCSQPSIAQGQGFCPDVCRLVIPQLVLLCPHGCRREHTCQKASH